MLREVDQLRADVDRRRARLSRLEYWLRIHGPGSGWDLVYDRAVTDLAPRLARLDQLERQERVDDESRAFAAMGL